MPASSKEFLDFEATIVCGFTLKRIRDMTRTQTELSGLMIFLTDLVLSYSDPYLFVYVGIFSGAVYFLSVFLL